MPSISDSEASDPLLLAGMNTYKPAQLVRHNTEQPSRHIGMIIRSQERRGAYLTEAIAQFPQLPNGVSLRLGAFHMACNDISQTSPGSFLEEEHASPTVQELPLNAAL
jgi:hypothetical protein